LGVPSKKASWAGGRPANSTPHSKEPQRYRRASKRTSLFAAWTVAHARRAGKDEAIKGGVVARGGDHHRELRDED